MGQAAGGIPHQPSHQHKPDDRIFRLYKKRTPRRLTLRRIHIYLIDGFEHSGLPDVP